MISKRSLFDGLCSMCGVLLYSTLGHNCTANYHYGPPISRDGRILINKSGEPDTKAQPPFLLRFSPQMFANECPEMFVHDPVTNNLSLRPDAFPPWIRKVAGHGFSGVKDRAKTWLYCLDCKNRWCPDTSQRPKAHIPFRDRASQLNMRPHKRAPVGSVETVVSPEQNTQPEPEPEEAVLDECGGGDVAPPMDDDAEDSDGDVVLPTEETVPEVPKVEYPTIEEYKARWAEKLAAHSKVQFTKGFRLETLVPKPLPALWQDCRGLSVRILCLYVLGLLLHDTPTGAKVLSSPSTTCAARRPSRDCVSVGLCRHFSPLR